MKTKPFLLATAGPTVDGRTVEDQWLKDIASSYNPKTYGARVNIEHIRGISGDKPFRAYGDVLELSTAEVEVDFNGTTEKRLGLFGVLDVTDDAKALNDASQKVYPSIEVLENFAGKGFAYLGGVALTDSPASIATERLQFNRSMPGAVHLARDVAAPLEFADAPDAQTTGLLSDIKELISGLSAKFTPTTPKTDPAQTDAKTDPAAAPAQAFTAADLAPLFENFATTVGKSIDGLRTEMREGQDQLSVKVKALETKAETTPAPGYTARPPADGGAQNSADVF